MKFALRGASSVAMVLGLAGVAWGQQAQTVQTPGPNQGAAAPQAAQADQTAPQAPAESTNRVVITGSLIAGASEDAPLPVDVYNVEDLKNEGSPNIQEFARSLSQSGETTGEFSILGGAATAGTSNVSLRGLGPSRTMTLLNGRRTTENTNAIPMGALQSIEVLKDGAGVTYGAGAVAGVVNFVTRRDVDGLELTVEQKMYDGSDGEFEINALTGWVGDSSNFLLSATYSHQSNLPFRERPELQFPYEQLPLQYTGGISAGTNIAPSPGTYFLDTGTTALPDFDQASCTSLGGFSRGNPECFYNFTGLYDLINQETDYRVYSEFNADLSDSMEFHVETTYSKADSPKVLFSPAGNPVASHRAVIGTTLTSQANLTSTSRMFQIPIVNDDWNGPAAGGGVRNPFVDKYFDDLRARYPLGVPSGTTGAAPFGAVPATNPAGGYLYTGNSWRPFSQGGNPLYDYGGRAQRNMRDFSQTAASLKGEFTEGTVFGLLSGINYNHSVSFDQSTSETFLPDIITTNMQNAMRGYGGPNCKAVDRIATDYSSVAAYDRTVGIQDTLIAPGSNGCLWFNPFASAYAANPFTKAAFSGYGGAAFVNSKELVDWLHEDRGTETQNQNLTLNTVFSGAIPFIALPGGEIAWAAGGEWRSEENRTRVVGSDGLRELSRQPCVWQDQTIGTTVAGTTVPVCTADKPGIWYENADQIDTDTYSDRHTYALYGELQVPVLDNLNFQLGLRRENFGTVEGDIYKVAGKWDILQDLSVRASYNTNFTAPPLGLRPGVPRTGVTFDATFLNTVPTTNIDAAGIIPEESTNRGFGVVWQPEFGDIRFRFSADYFDIQDENQIVTTSLRTILNQVAPTSATFVTGTTTITQVGGGRNRTTARLDCDAPLMAFITLDSTCDPGVTTAENITDIRLTTLNGPGQNTTGIDYQLDMRVPLMGGELSAGFTGTQVLTYDVKGYSLQSVVIDAGGDRLGFQNTSRTGEFSSEFRGNAYVGFNVGDITLRGQANYVSGVEDELGCAQSTTAPGGTAPAPSCYGVYPENYMDFDVHLRYQPSFMKDLELRASILNVTEVDPPGDQRARDGYSTSIAPNGARGRQFEVALSKKF